MVKISKKTILFSAFIITAILCISIFFSNQKKDKTTGDSGDSGDLLSFNSNITDIDRYNRFHSTIHEVEKVENFIPRELDQSDIERRKQDRIRLKNDQWASNDNRVKNGYIMDLKNDDYYSAYSSNIDSYMELDTNA